MLESSVAKLMFGTVEDSKPLRGEARGEIVHTQDEILQNGSISGDQGRVEVYSFVGGFVQIPTIIEPPEKLLNIILGNRIEKLDGLLVSPTLGVADEEYYKSASEMRLSKHRGAWIEKDGKPAFLLTDEDAVRYWITRAPEFIKELTNQGWIYFKPFKELTEIEKQRMDRLGVIGYHMRQANIPLDKLIKVLDRPNSSIAFQVADLKEVQAAVGSAGDEAIFNYELQGGPYKCHFVIPFSYGSRGSTGSVPLVLSGMQNFLQDQRRNKRVPLLRTAYLELPFKSASSVHNSWWNSDHSNRVLKLVRQYAEKNKIGDLQEERSPANQEGVILSVSDRPLFSEPGTDYTPDTKGLLSQVVELRDFVHRACSFEGADHEARQTEVYDRRLHQLDMIGPSKEFHKI